jgi:GABA(A) receptor-associated protein
MELRLKPGEAERLIEKFPGRVPVLVQRHTQAKNIPDIDKNKFLVPDVLTIGQFIYVVRKRINLEPDKALFMFVNNTLPTTGSLIKELYHAYKGTDGALHIVYTSESVFGGGDC